jgi:hypothetical protein
MTSMVGPLGALPASSTTSTSEFEDDIDGGPPEGRCRQRPPLSLKMTMIVGPRGVLPVGPVAFIIEF